MNPERAMIIADLLRWATGYYPERVEPPSSIVALEMTDAEIGELFTCVPHRRAHLALIDQAPIRDRVRLDPDLSAHVKTTWQDKPWS
jgi:hypothetical protein